MVFRHTQVTSRDEAVTVQPPLGLDNHIVLGAMKSQHAVELGMEVAVGLEVTIEMSWVECHSRPP